MAEIAIKKKRPKNLDLPTIRLPLPGVLSILHRISGAVLFLLLPVLLWLFQQSLASPESYAVAKAVTSNFLVKIILLGLIWLLSRLRPDALPRSAMHAEAAGWLGLMFGIQADDAMMARMSTDLSR